MQCRISSNFYGTGDNILRKKFETVTIREIKIVCIPSPNCITWPMECHIYVLSNKNFDILKILFLLSFDCCKTVYKPNNETGDQIQEEASDEFPMLSVV